MTAATALVSGHEAVPQLAEQAVREALLRVGGNAGGVLLFLSADFARHAQAAVLAAARAARCTQVFGGIFAGVCTEAGWGHDRPAAAAMVLAGGVSLAAQPANATDTAGPLLCCTSTPFPSEWKDVQRYGSHFHGNAGNGAVWQQSRVMPQGSAETLVTGARVDLAVSTGMRPLGEALPVGEVRGYDLVSLGGQSALDSLLHVLPADWRERQPLPVHLINALLTADAPQTAAVISVNADRSLTLSAPPQPGQRLAWAIRQPLAAEADMCASLDALGTIEPDFGLFLSCIGRGPWFYGGKDRDLAALVERFPGLPLLGAYGTGQIAFRGNSSRQLQNTVVSAFFSETSHV